MIAKRQSSFKPCLEVLEDRLCPSGSGTVPPGTIYFANEQLVQDQLGFYYNFTGNWSMNGDGSSKTSLPNFPQAMEPSQLIHSQRWALYEAPTTGAVAFPNGQPEYDFYASSQDGTVKVQLTNNPSLPNGSRIQVVFAGFNWSPGDSFISFPADTWTPVTSGGNYTDSKGQQWQVGAGVFNISILWSTDATTGMQQPAAQALTQVPVNVGIWFPSAASANQSSFQPSPNFQFPAWSPSGSQMAYDLASNTSPGGVQTHYLDMATFSSGTLLSTSTLTTEQNPPGNSAFFPEWSPDGSHIAYVVSASTNNGIWTVQPNGSANFQVESGHVDGNSRANWSPDNKYLAFTYVTQSNAGGLTHWLYNVDRVAATGGKLTNLTGDIDSQSLSSFSVAWRSNSLATSASTASTLPAAWPSGRTDTVVISAATSPAGSAPDLLTLSQALSASRPPAWAAEPYGALGAGSHLAHQEAALDSGKIRSGQLNQPGPGVYRARGGIAPAHVLDALFAELGNSLVDHEIG